MIGAAAGFIAEDRSTMNLRFMGMAGVKPWQYLVGTAGTLLIVSFVALVLFALLAGYTNPDIAINFMALTMLGAVNSLLLGITISLTRFAPLTGLVGLLLGVGPIFADANEFLASIYSVLYTMHVIEAVREQMDVDLNASFQIMLINTAVLVVAFLVINWRNGLEGDQI